MGELAFIVGPVGSGKTSLLTAILGEMVKLDGKYAVRQNRTIAYASQSPWIINGTLKENILFGRVFDSDWFWKVIDVCAMEHDLALLENKEDTMLGDRGVNLSGGQRARLALARAVYARADIYCMFYFSFSSLQYWMIR
jgi:ABC-type transport system involved in cytochrome bd biosynthesis fused ATPase/permease subunit